MTPGTLRSGLAPFERGGELWPAQTGGGIGLCGSGGLRRIGAAVARSVVVLLACRYACVYLDARRFDLVDIESRVELSMILEKLKAHDLPLENFKSHVDFVGE